MARLLLRHADWIYACDGARRVISDGHVLIENGRIAAVGPELSPPVEAEETVSMAGCLVTPRIVAGAVVAFIMSFDNFSRSLFITKSDTLPLRLMQHIRFYLDPSVAAVATLLVAISRVVALTLGHLARGAFLRVGA